MRKLFTFGETVYDIIFKNDNPVEGRPGGAMVNTAVSLGRLNAPVCLVTGYPDDRLGDIVDQCLVKNRVNTDYVTRYKGARSRIALAFLNENKDAEYSFYKIQHSQSPTLLFPEPQQDDIVLFGSFYAMKSDIRVQVVRFISNARKNGAIIIYDPNFRKAHLGMLSQVKGYIEENISLSHIVKGSDEDFFNVYGCLNPDDAYSRVKEIGDSNLIYTANKHGVYVRSSSLVKHYKVPAIDPISTVGAGDSFNAGLMWALYKYGISRNQIPELDENHWDKILKIASEFGTHSCMSFDNYISEDFANKYSDL